MNFKDQPKSIPFYNESLNTSQLKAFAYMFALSAKPAICEGENAFGINWKETKPGASATRTCPREAKGK